MVQSGNQTNTLTPLSDAQIEHNFSAVQHAVRTFDPTSPEFSYLHSHQRVGIGDFVQAVQTDLTLDRFAEGAGIYMVSPTGSGKTVMMAAILSLMERGFREQSPEAKLALRALVGVPRRKIGRQTVGQKEQQGITSFAPELSVGIVDNKAGDPRSVNVACYQSFPGLLRNDRFSTLDPNVIIGDEVHRIIKGEASTVTRQLAAGRLLVGFTATPVYHPERTIYNLFPIKGTEQSMRDGIKEGYLASLEGHLFQASTRIITRTTRDGDYNESDIYKALVDMQDFDIVAKVIAMETTRGRKGVIHCAPGQNRAISKEMARRLSQTEVVLQDGSRRFIRAVHVDGDMTKTQLDAILSDLEAGRIDVVTNTDLITEGFDADIDYGFNTRPMSSKVLAEQALGRIMRAGKNGRKKIATYYELIYNIAISDRTRDRSQVTHLDILGEETVTQGRDMHQHLNGAAGPSRRRHRRRNVDAELHAALGQLDTLTVEEVKISNGQKAIPGDWVDSRYLGYAFGIPFAQVDRILQKAKIGFCSGSGDFESHTFYPDRAEAVLAEHLGITTAEEGDVMFHELIELAQDSIVHSGKSAHQLRRLLANEGFETQVKMNRNGKVIRCYAGEARELFKDPVVEWSARRIERRTPVKTAKPRQRLQQTKPVMRKPVMQETADQAEVRRKHEEKQPDTKASLTSVRSWGLEILSEKVVPSVQKQKEISAGREHLRTQLRLLEFNPVPSEFSQAVYESGLRPTKAMKELMERFGVDQPTLLYCMKRAQGITKTAILRGKL